MSLKKFFKIIACITISFNSNAMPPVEVVHSCKNALPPNSGVTMVQLPMPVGIETNETGCDFRAEHTENNLTYGILNCNSDDFLTINNHKIKFKAAKNYSINPSVGPGSTPIKIQSDWFKIDFNGQSYLCISGPAAESGDGVNYSEYYIVDNLNSAQPILNYFFFDKDIMSLTDS